MTKKDTNKNIPEQPTKIEVRSSELIRQGRYQEANQQALIESRIYDFAKKNIKMCF